MIRCIGPSTQKLYRVSVQYSRKATMHHPEKNFSLSCYNLKSHTKFVQINSNNHLKTAAKQYIYI